MNKRILVLAVAAAMAAPLAAQAGDPQVFGRVHVAAESVTVGDADAVGNISGSGPKSISMGVKGSTETNLMGMEAVYQFSIGLDQDSGTAGALSQFDTFVGLSSKSLGTVRGGTLPTSYKQSAGTVDPLFGTALEGRGSLLGLMSNQMHNGTGDGRGRSTHTVRYDSPSIAGAAVSFDYQTTAMADNMGFGATYKGGPVAAFVDFQSIGEIGGGKSGTATKLGGKFSMSGASVGLSYEMDGGAISKNEKGDGTLLFLNGGYTMGATMVTLTYGMATETVKDAKNDYSSLGVAVVQSVAKATSIYAGYGQKSYGTEVKGTLDNASAIAVGMNHAF